MDYLYLITVMLAGVCFIISVVTGAFFSRPVGTKLGGAGAVMAALAIWGGVGYGLPWWALVLPAGLLLLNAFLGIAAIGGEE